MSSPPKQESIVTALPDEDSIDIRKTIDLMPEIDEAIKIYEFLKFKTELNMYHYYFDGLTEEEITEKYFDKLFMQYFHHMYDKTEEEIEAFCKSEFNKSINDD